MLTEQFALMLVLAAAQLHAPQTTSVPADRDVRQAMIQAVKEPELVTALSLRAKRLERPRQDAVVNRTLLASVR
ncbi:MAG TPA: hypothetical protein PKH69_02790 [Thiobacillaceae bacterium]|nr:hypothetical protein [Thiobacillaceae bacterium]HNU63014.1 hypothetical protein [Thiobacillaceae bacterium]